MRRLLLDTHAWVWYVAGSGDLPSALREAIDDSLGDCWLSPISLWEVGMLESKGRLCLRQALQPWIDETLAAFPVREAPLSFEIVRRVPELDLPRGDPADHFLAATAVVYGLTLVTVDRNLVGAAWLDTLTAS